MPLATALDAIIAGLDQIGSESLYVGSVPVPDYLPGFEEENAMPLGACDRAHLAGTCRRRLRSLLIRSTIWPVSWRAIRRFTLYAPELVNELYPGPIDHTMAGQPVSLAASMPDDDRFPRFRAVRDRAAGGGVGTGRRALYTQALVAPGPVHRAVQWPG